MGVVEEILKFFQKPEEETRQWGTKWPVRVVLGVPAI